MSRSTQLDTTGSHHATDDPTDDDFLLTDTGLVQRILTSPSVLLFAGLTVVALVAERSLVGAGPLGGGALVPASGGAAGALADYLQGFHPTGIGSGISSAAVPGCRGGTWHAARRQAVAGGGCHPAGLRPAGRHLSVPARPGR